MERSITSLTTHRMDVRPFLPEDIGPLARIAGDAEVMRFVGDGPIGRVEAERWIERSRENVEQHGYGTAGVVLKCTRELIGWAGFARPDYGGEEVVYALDRPHWGLGLGRELLRALVDFKARVEPTGEIRATVDPANAASVHLLKTTGFELIDPRFQGQHETALYVRPPTRGRATGL